MAAILRYDLELTDTFAGQANYSWVQRETIAIDANYTGPWIVRQAKAALGLTGLKGTTTDYGHTIEVRFAGTCQILFISLVS